ncbi:hypothetical protein AT746_17045 [Lacimicrobium alkaliphilum]|uniref:Uncharacterized protein n=1 Tax=Lacimicrobium alkaliphilum TaxID=1526571 RepID=A0A0U2ZNE3_9ALTE|nr:hypothetical protein AT746_17045 [Lacimicrobium alkaliphilum]
MGSPEEGFTEKSHWLSDKESPFTVLVYYLYNTLVMKCKFFLNWQPDFFKKENKQAVWCNGADLLSHH